MLQKAVPDHGFLGEEGGVSGNADSEYLWCIDPIDGTTNFAAAYPSFGVSVAGNSAPFESCQLYDRSQDPTLGKHGCMVLSSAAFCSHLSRSSFATN